MAIWIRNQCFYGPFGSGLNIYGPFGSVSNVFMEHLDLDTLLWTIWILIQCYYGQLDPDPNLTGSN